MEGLAKSFNTGHTGDWAVQTTPRLSADSFHIFKERMHVTYRAKPF